MTYYCWMPKRELESYGHEYGGGSPKAAAALHAEHLFYMHGGWGTPDIFDNTIRVRISEGDPQDFTISMHTEPVFTANLQE